jgi:8-oxo-dGTP pyrophosphatase MutT (NUDIX family)
VTGVDVSLVDLYVLRGAGPALECLVLRRGAGGRCPGSWETVHGHIESGETPAAAAIRARAEETGAPPTRRYNLSRVEAFYRHGPDMVALIPVFVAFVDQATSVRLSSEHDRFEWLPAAEARRRFSWPREGRALEDAVALLGTGDAGPVEDVLRVC